MYPAGASPTDVLDMAGTVWEWCLNKFEAPEVTRSGADDFDPRVLRGGSWGYDRDGARSAYRVRDVPGDRVNLVGFRVVCSSPSSGTESLKAPRRRRKAARQRRLRVFLGPDRPRRDRPAVFGGADRPASPGHGGASPNCRRCRRG